MQGNPQSLERREAIATYPDVCEDIRERDNRRDVKEKEHLYGRLQEERVFGGICTPLHRESHV